MNVLLKDDYINTPEVAFCVCLGFYIYIMAWHIDVAV